jgi:hypothetical protein
MSSVQNSTGFAKVMKSSFRRQNSEQTIGQFGEVIKIILLLVFDK